MSRKLLFEINGIKYMTPKAAGHLWDMSPQKVTAACNDGRIENIDKDSSGHWIIPVDSRKPLEAEYVRTLLISILALKNRPDSNVVEIDTNQFSNICDYLKGIGLIEQFDKDSKQFPFDIILAKKGFEIATQGKPINLDWLNISNTIVTLISIAIAIWP